MKKKTSVTDDIISKILNHEMHKHNKGIKDKVSTTTSLGNSTYDEQNTLLKKKKKKKKSKTLIQLTTISPKKNLNTKSCDEYDKSMKKTKTGATNSYKDQLSSLISKLNASEDDKELILLKKKKKKMKKDKKKTLTQLSPKKKKSINKTKTGATNSYTDKSLMLNPNASEDDKEFTVLKKEKKKKKKDKIKIQNSENSISSQTTFNTEKSCHTQTNEDTEGGLNKIKKKIHKANKAVISKDTMLGSENDKEALSLTNTKEKKRKKKKEKYCEVQNTNNLENNDTKKRNHSQINERIDLLSEHNVRKKKPVKPYKENSKDDDEGYTSLLKMMVKRMKKKKKKAEKLTQFTTISPKKKLDTKPCNENCKSMDITAETYSNQAESTIPMSYVNASEGDKQLTLIKKEGKKKKKYSKVHMINNLENNKVVAHTEKKNCSDTNDFELVSDLYEHIKTINDHQNKKKKKKHSKRAAIEKTESIKEETKHKHPKKMKSLKNYISERISEDHTEEMFKDAALATTSLKDYEMDPSIFIKSKKKKKKKTDVKSVASKETVSPRKSKKLKRQSTDKECFENDIPQTAHIDIEKNRSEVACEDIKNNFELIFAENDHKTNEHLVKIEGRDSCQNYAIKESDKCKQQTADKEILEYDVKPTVYMDEESNRNENHINENSKLNFEFRFAGDDCKTATNVNERPYKCDVCDISVSHKSSLVTHKRTHTGEKPYKCDVCDISFSKKSTLVSHKRTHTGEKPYKCEVCGISFSKKSTLVSHKRTHTGERPYKCDVCGISVSEKSSLVKHKRTHTGDRPYECDVCGISFSIKSSLVTHKRTHTGEKPYKCDVCGISVSYNSAMVTHKRTHTGERPYDCGLCEKSFITSSHRTRHTRRIHYKQF